MEYTWLIVAVLVMVMLIIVFKSQDLLFIFVLFKKYFPVILFFSFIVLVSFAVNNINKNYDTDYTSLKGLSSTAKIYFVWVKDFAVKVARVTGEVIHQDWFSDYGENRRARRR